MSNGTRRRDEWERSSDSEVLRDIAQNGLRYGEDCDGALRSRLMEIVQRVEDTERAASTVWPQNTVR